MRDPETIEREIAAERDRLVQALRALEARLSPEALVQGAADRLRGPATNASGLARDNPLALALIGSGVAWLVASAARHEKDDVQHGPSAAAYDPRIKPTAPGMPDEGDPMTGSMVGFDARLAAADADADGDTDAKSDQAFAGDTTMSMTETDLYDTELSSRREGGKRARLRQTARELRSRLYDGLDTLPDSAKARILDARLKAIEVQSAIEARIARGSNTVRKGASENPLLVGAIAFGIGAAVAAALPRTSVENRALGARRDQLLDDADRMLREETAKLSKVAEAAVAEGKQAVKDTLNTGLPSEDDPVERVHAAAKREAEAQEVGKVN